MPAHNAAATIGAAISGVLTQTVADVELLVVDDGSTDATGAIARSFGDPVQVLSGPRRGTSAARNLALAQATGTHVAFCDADDLLLPAYLERSLALVASGHRWIATHDPLVLTPAGLAHGQRLGLSVPVLHRQRLGMLQLNFATIFSVFPRELLDEVGGFRDDLTHAEDWDLWIRAVLAGWRFVQDPEPHAVYRVAPSSKSSQSDDVFRCEDLVLRSVLERHGDGGLTDGERDYLEARLRMGAPRSLDYEALRAMARGDHPEARAIYRRLSTVSWVDRDFALKTVVLSRFPGATRAFHHRWTRRGTRLGRVIGEHRV